MTISPSLGEGHSIGCVFGNTRLPQLAPCFLIEDESEEVNIMTGERTGGFP